MRILNAHIYKILITAVVTLAMMFPSPMYAVGYYFKQLSTNDGLSQSTVQCIYRDSKGFLWIGTRYGLNLYDNERITTFYSNPNDLKNTIVSNDIKFIVEDNEGTVWVASLGGLATYDSQTGTFVEQKCGGKNINVRSYCLTDGGVLLGGAESLYFYSYKEKKISRVKATGGSKMFYNNICRMVDGSYLLVTRWDGAWIYKPNTATIVRFNALKDSNIRASYIDSHGNIYISPYGDGIYCFAPNFQLKYHVRAEDGRLSSNFVTDMEECDGKLWIGTDGGGINLLDIDSQRAQPLETSSHLLPISSVLCLYKDSDDNMWAGTIRGGVMYIHGVYMHTYSNMLKDDNRWMSARTVLSMTSLHNGNILLGIDDGGVCEYNPVTNKFKEYPSTFGMKVASLAEIDADNVIVSEYASGIFALNKSTGKLSRITYINNEKDSRLHKNPLAINIVPFGDKQYALISDSIYLYSLQSKKSVNIPLPSGKYKGGLSCFYYDEKQIMLFRSNEIYSLDPIKCVSQQIHRINKNQNITCAQYDGNRYVYYATSHNIYRLDTSTGETALIESEMFKSVTAMALDGNRLWIGAQNSLYLRLLDSNRTLIFGQADGVETNEFINKSILKTPLGIYMGGINGLLRIDNNAAEEILKTNSSIEIQLTDVLIDGISQSQYIKKMQVDVPYDHSSVTIRLIDRERNTFRRKQFKYIIKGDAKDNIIMSTERTLTLNMLQSGEYYIYVSCSTQDGGWTQPVMLAQLDVLTPWWRSGSAMCAYVVLLLLTWLVATRFLYKKKKAKILLMMKEQERESYEKQVNFLVNINHELRTPLTLIYAPLKRLLSNMKNVEKAEIEGELKGVYRQTRKMRNIINMILDIKKLEQGHTELRMSNTDVNKWVIAALKDFALEFEARKITLNMNLDENLGVCMFDPEKVDLVLSNIVINAIKYTKPESTITIATQQSDKYVRISVSDCGPGLNGVDPNKLFTMFYQGDNAVFGTGLGLAYSKALVTLHNGNIGAEENVNGEGATFWFELPLDEVNVVQSRESVVKDIYDVDVMPSSKELVASEDFDMTSYSAIVIEDDVDLNAFMVMGVQPYFGTIYNANNGKDALRIIKQNKPDIIISDVMLPQMNGFELCRRVKSDETLRHIPVLLLTTRVNEDNIERGYRLGADSYMSKPFNLDMLLARCRNLIHNRTIVRQRYSTASSVGIVDAPNINNSNETFIMQIDKIIIDNIDNPDLSVDTIVEKMLMSRTSIYNRLKEITGYSIGDYINELRLKQAKEILSNSDIPISEISSRLGFSSQRYFSTFFKNKTGVTPSSFRASNQK